jgi:hypothetical protein
MPALKLKPVLMWACFAVMWLCALGVALQIGELGLGMWMAKWVVIGLTAGVSMHFCHDIYMDDRMPKVPVSSDSSDWE